MFLPAQYEFFCPVKTNSGNRALEHLPVELDALNARKPLIITSKDLSGRGLADVMADAFKDSGLTLGIFDGTSPAPDLKLIRELTKIYRHKGYDAIIALGGGSVMDAAKALNIVVSGRPEDLEHAAGEDRMMKPLKPLIWVPAGEADGYESSKYATIGPLNFSSPYLMPHLVVLDPRMTIQENMEKTAASALIVLTHAVEAYTGPAKNPMTDAYAYAAIALIMTHLMDVMKNLQNEKGCLALANAASMAGCAFSNSPKGLVHTLGSALALACGLSPGLCMGILLPYGLEYNTQKHGFHTLELLMPLAGPDVYAGTAGSLRSRKALDILYDLQDKLVQASGGMVPRKLADMKVPKEKLTEIAQTAGGENITGWEGGLSVLEQAWQGKPATPTS